MVTFIPHLEPLWPLLAVTSAATLLAALTIWTYRGVPHAGKGRVALLLAVRLAALAIACLILLRPTWDYREVNRNPTTLIILADASKSMLVKDEDPSISRWKAAQQDWNLAAELLQQLQDEQHLQVVSYQFDSQLRELKWDQEPQGDRTALLKALDEGYEHHKPFDKDRSSQLLGIVLYSDGRDNVGKPALESVIARLARAPCPVHVIGLGAPGGSELQPDLIAMNIEAPQAARVKDRMIVRGAIQAQRYVGQEVEVWLRIDGKPVDQADNPGQPVRLLLRPTSAVQSIPIELPAAKLPDQPGDVKVSIWIKPLQGELTETNNEVATYVTLIKEGLSVLYLDKDRAWEPKFIKRALKGDERITLYSAFLGEDTGAEAEAWRRDLLRSLKASDRPYDVYILGDIPASRFAPQTGMGKEILERIKEHVSNGAGLVMIGGHESFGNGRDGRGTGSWQGTPMETLLPVEMDARGQLEGPAGAQREIKFVPTDAGLRHFALRLDSDAQQNREWWDRLRPLDGGNRLGTRKPGASELAKSPDGELLLAAQEYGKGRTAALAVDTTWRWFRPGPPHDPRDKDKPGALSESAEAHLRLWRQLILWLARQEEAGKALRVELDHRRLAAGKEQGITVQAREVAPGGNRDAQKVLKDAEFTVKVHKPGQLPDAQPDTVTVTPDGGTDGKSRGMYWKTDEPGEYEVEVTARHQGADLGLLKARFMTYRDDSELLNRTANHSLLEQIARTTGGTYRLHGGLRSLLEEINPASATEAVKILKMPDWKEPNPWLQTLLFLVFVGCICGEWFLRRWWGLV
jgi:uncharacterized membrane protein